MTNPLRWLALVALERPEMPSAASVVEGFAEADSHAESLQVVESTDALLTFSIAEFTAAATLVTRPIPWSQLEGPCATAWYWPDAAETLRGHPAHLLLTLIDEGGKSIVKASHLTHLTAAVARCSPSTAVFWGPSRMIHPSSAFAEQADQMTCDDLPLFIWVDFRIEQLDDQGVRLYTTGLDALGGVEMEVSRYEGAPQELLECVYNIAHYQLSQNKEISDGDTIGLTDEVQVTARRQPSMFDENLEVIGLQISASQL